jgi:hypothetical protein
VEKEMKRILIVERDQVMSHQMRVVSHLLKNHQMKKKQMHVRLDQWYIMGVQLSIFRTPVHTTRMIRMG